MWRLENNIQCATIGDGKKARSLGSRLHMPMAEESPANFLTKGIQEIVKSEVKDPIASADKLYGKPRIYNDLLSSQPLCFNLFGELVSNLSLVSKVMNELTDGRFCEVVKIQFEVSPGRGNPLYLGDRSAFDVLLECRTSSGGRGFIGIEVKYHENLRGKAGDHKPRYDEVANDMKCFPADLTAFKSSPMQQLWRDHLLAGAMKDADEYDDAQFVVLYSKGNNRVADAVKRYSAFLSNTDSFCSWTLEEFVFTLKKYSNANWIDLFYDRYLAFEKIDKLLNEDN